MNLLVLIEMVLVIETPSTEHGARSTEHGARSTEHEHEHEHEHEQLRRLSGHSGPLSNTSTL